MFFTMTDIQVVICSFQVLNPADYPNDEIIEINVTQRLLYRLSLTNICTHCAKRAKTLRACNSCYDALYCNRYDR